MKHTPGPWKVVKELDTWMVASCGDGLMIQSPQCHGDSLGLAEDDANLIAAAPELLSALKDIFQMMDEGVIVRDISKDHLPGFAGMALGFVTRLKFAHDAIEKAEGKVPSTNVMSRADK